MSLMKTFPSWASDVVATDRGWTNSKTGEIYVSIRNLPARLAEEKLREQAKVFAALESTPVPVEVVEEVKIIEVVPVEVVETKQEVVEQEVVKEIIVETPKIEDAEKPAKRAYTKKQKVNEVVEHDSSKKIIGEVVEYDLSDKQVIGE